MKPPTPVDRHLIIHKAERKLELFDGEKLLRSYKIALGSCPVGDKEIEGDGKTPEGQYYVFVKNPESKFHLSLGLSYPSRASAERGLAAGVITRFEFDSDRRSQHEHGTELPQKTRLGGEIYVHGGGTGRLDRRVHCDDGRRDGRSFRGRSCRNQGHDLALEH